MNRSEKDLAGFSFSLHDQELEQAGQEILK